MGKNIPITLHPQTINLIPFQKNINHTTLKTNNSPETVSKNL